MPRVTWVTGTVLVGRATRPTSFPTLRAPTARLLLSLEEEARIRMVPQFERDTPAQPSAPRAHTYRHPLPLQRT